MAHVMQLHDIMSLLMVKILRSTFCGVVIKILPNVASLPNVYFSDIFYDYAALQEEYASRCECQTPKFESSTSISMKITQMEIFQPKYNASK
jgi:hypothetical protein